MSGPGGSLNPFDNDDGDSATPVNAAGRSANPFDDKDLEFAVVPPEVPLPASPTTRPSPSSSPSASNPFDDDDYDGSSPPPRASGAPSKINPSSSCHAPNG